MAGHSTSRYVMLASRGFRNYVTGRPLSVSFEVTYSCNARCKHCHLGGRVANEILATPEEYGELCQRIKPVVAQVSGGEPLIRRDLENIIRALKKPRRAPFVVLTTNGVLLTKDRFLSLFDAGVDSYSLSLDYPDERHDTFRGVPGLFRKIETLVNDLEDGGKRHVTLSCVVQRDNVRELLSMAELATKWNVSINFSTYTWLRTGDRTYVPTAEELEELQSIVARLLDIREKQRNIYASEYVFRRMIEFFRNESLPGCRAGEKFFIVNPDGTLSPCGLILGAYRSQKEIKEKFVKNNPCTGCNTSIRANCEKPAWYLFKDTLHSLR